jgi:hypothetical protein
LRRLDERPIYVAAPSALVPAWEPMVDFVLPDLFEEGSAAHFLTLPVNSKKPLLPMIGLGASRSARARNKQGKSQRAAPSEKLDDWFEKFGRA